MKSFVQVLVFLGLCSVSFAEEKAPNYLPIVLKKLVKESKTDNKPDVYSLTALTSVAPHKDLKPYTIATTGEYLLAITKSVNNNPELRVLKGKTPKGQEFSEQLVLQASTAELKPDGTIVETYCADLTSKKVDNFGKASVCLYEVVGNSGVAFMAFVAK